MNDEKLAMANLLRREISHIESLIAALSDPAFSLKEIFEDYPEASATREAANIFRQSLIDDYSRRLGLIKEDFESI